MTTVQDAPIDVLIADDDAELRHSMRLLLEVRGYRCAEAADGREAVDLALRHHPRCLLLDVAMPEMDGYAVARQLRADPRTSGTHIHVVSGLSDPDAPKQARDAGCELFLHKPITPEVLLEIVRAPAAGPLPGVVMGLTMANARDLLDWLQNQGCTKLEVAMTDGTFAVRCLCPPGRRLVQSEDGDVRLERA
jgi:CheY-like chemotaxis protein